MGLTRRKVGAKLPACPYSLAPNTFPCVRKLRGAWSQDALWHMEKATVLTEVASVLQRDAVFAFTDFIARSRLTSEDCDTLARGWGF